MKANINFTHQNYKLIHKFTKSQPTNWWWQRRQRRQRRWRAARGPEGGGRLGRGSDGEQTVVRSDGERRAVRSDGERRAASARGTGVSISDHAGRGGRRRENREGRVGVLSWGFLLLLLFYYFSLKDVSRFFFKKKISMRMLAKRFTNFFSNLWKKKKIRGEPFNSDFQKFLNNLWIIRELTNYDYDNFVISNSKKSDKYI